MQTRDILACILVSVFSLGCLYLAVQGEIEALKEFVVAFSPIKIVLVYYFVYTPEIKPK